jgi:hypothetical protein
MLQLVNAFREQNGFVDLQPAASLNRAAAWMANDMNTTSKVDHIDSLTRNTLQRQVDCGQLENAGGEENLYIGTGTAAGAQAAFDWWKASTAGHKEAMLRATNVFVGVAHVGGNWALELSPGRGNDVISPMLTAGVSLVPSAVCLGGCTITPGVTQSAPSTSPTVVISQSPSPAVSSQPSVSLSPQPSGTTAISSTVLPSAIPSGTLPGSSSGNNGFFSFILALIAAIIKFLLSLIGR